MALRNVQGLSSQLQRYSRAAITTLAAGGSAGAREILLIDAASLEAALIARLGSTVARYDNDKFIADFFQLAASYVRGLRRTGLKVVAVAEGAVAAGGEAAAARRKQLALTEGAFPGPLASVALAAAIELEGGETLHAAEAATQLLLSYYFQNEKRIFALLTDDTNFFVYGVERISFLADVCVGPDAVDFSIWTSSAAWRDWRQTWLNKGGPPSLKHRAQVAALLGGDVADLVRQANGCALTASGLITAPIIAAQLCLQQPFDDDLQLSFFTNWLGLKNFTEDDVVVFNKIVAEFSKRVDAARGSQPAALQPSGVAAPWLQSAAATSLASPCAPADLSSWAFRGIAFRSGVEGGAASDAARAAAAAKLFKPGSELDVFDYDPQAGEVVKLVSAASGAKAPAGWFTPEALPGTNLRDATASKAAAPAAAAAAKDTAAAVAKGGVAPAFALHAALLLHFSSGALSGDAVRSALMPAGLPDIGDAPPAIEDADVTAITEALADHGAGAIVIDVGSALTADDWNEIDNKEVVAACRAGGAFKVMRAIVPWSPEPALPESFAPPLDEAAAFRYCYVQRQEAAFWRALAKTGCAGFARRYAEADADKAVRKELEALGPKGVLGELTRAAAAGDNPEAVHTVALLEALTNRTAPDLLLLRRCALAAGAESAEWAFSVTAWANAAPRARAEALAMQHSWSNRGPPASLGGRPVLYPHQKALLDLLDSHLDTVNVALRKGAGFPLPLRCILSTPTGSGKTFTAMLLHLQLLRSRHQSVVLLYSVPTKQVLKRVGQECEAHGVVYWTAAAVGDLTKYEVRRPYSIRTQREKGPDQARAGTSSMAEQIKFAGEAGDRLKDRPAVGDSKGGRPEVIIADVFATAALLAAVKTGELKGLGLTKHSVVLYFDEPNMGLHLSKATADAAASIMRDAPVAAVLASATLPSWGALPSWWRGDGSPASRTVITQEPYDLPHAALAVLSNGRRGPLNLLSLFPTFASFSAVVRCGSQRLRVLLLRYLTASQANSLLIGSGVATPTAESTEPLLGALNSSVRTAREQLELALLALADDPKRFAELKRAWAAEAKAASTPAASLRAACSTSGVTLIATLNPRRVAMELAGWGPDGENAERWAAETHAMKNVVAGAIKSSKAAAKERERVKNEDARPDDLSAPPGFVPLRPGLSVAAEEAASADEDSLVMLSKGIAYAAGARDAQPPALAKRLYQQALLSVPERATMKRLPPVHILVVDYSSIYGTDCPAVDTIILLEDLGKALTYEDHQQFLGRLRRDGTAIYLSADTVRAATLGPLAAAVAAAGAGAGANGAAESDDEEDEEEMTPEEAADEAVEAAMKAGGSKAAAAKAGKALEAARKEGKWPAGQTGCHLLRSVLRRCHAALGKGAAAASADPKGLPAAVKAAVATWAAPLSAFAKSAADQAALIAALVPALNASAEGPRGEAGLKALPLAVMELYEGDALSEEAIQKWGKAQSGALATAIAPVLKWLEEAEEEDDDEEE